MVREFAKPSLIHRSRGLNKPKPENKLLSTCCYFGHAHNCKHQSSHTVSLYLQNDVQVKWTSYKCSMSILSYYSHSMNQISILTQSQPFICLIRYLLVSFFTPPYAMCILVFPGKRYLSGVSSPYFSLSHTKHVHCPALGV